MSWAARPALFALLSSLLVLSSAQAAAPLPACPSSGIVTTLTLRDTGQRSKNGLLVATHPLRTSATASPPASSEWLIDLDSVSVTPGVMNGTFGDFTPMTAGPLDFLVNWVQTRSVPDPDNPGAWKDEACQGSQSRSFTVLPARSAKVGSPVHLDEKTWFVGRSGLFDLPFHASPKQGDHTPVIVTLRARRGMQIPHSGPSSQMRVSFRGTDGGTSEQKASMNGVRIRLHLDQLEISMWKDPGPNNGVQIDVTQGARLLRSVRLQLHCSRKIAAVYACIYHLR